MRVKFKKIIALILVLSVFSVVSPGAPALTDGSDIPFDTYSYSDEDGILKDTAAYTVATVINGAGFGVGNLNKPSDLFIDEIGRRIYIADTGNNRIISCNYDFSEPVIMDSVLTPEGPSVFKSPNGVYKQGELLYIADTENNRVISMDKDGILRREYTRPVSPQFSRTVEYKPLKVAVSAQGDIYILSDGIFEGIINIDLEGEFQGYAGMNLVKPNLWDVFWRAVSTKKQRESMAAFLPVTFTNFDLDESGFLYAASQIENNGGNALKRLNPGGSDVMQSIDGPIVGDRGAIYSGKNTGNSVFSDVVSLKSGMVACTDRTRGHIFLYNSDGKMMFAFGGTGDQYGCVAGPAGIDGAGYTLYVLDSIKNCINVYSPTDYGMSLLNGEEHLYKGEYQEAEACYRKALVMNSSCESAYLGIGKAQLLRGETNAAMKSFRLAGNQAYYGKALEKAVKDFTNRNFAWIASFCVIIFLLFLFRKRLGGLFPRKKHEKSPENKLGQWFSGFFSSLDFSIYPILHPFKGFHQMKYERRGNRRSMVFILCCFAVTSVCGQMFTGYSFSSARPEDVNILTGLVTAVVPVLLFSLSNWCVTALMDGEGNFRYILMSTTYALIPLIAVKAVMIAASQIMGPGSAAVYYLIQSFVFIFMAFLVFVGNMTVHNYSGSKTLVTMLLTFLGMAIIVFLVLLIFNLFMEVRDFIVQIYREILFRL